MQGSNEQEMFNISFIARRLKMRENNQHKTVLVLGSRASSLFRSEALYGQLKYFSDSILSDPEQPQTKKFGACYDLLTSPMFSPAEIDQILRQALKEVTVEGEDLCLARLVVVLRLFDVIITTCLDPIFEQALEMVGWKELRDFDMYTPPLDPQKYDPLSHQRVPCRLVKVFGQLTTSEYIIHRGNHIKQHPSLHSLLQNLLQRDCLILGLDPVWDAEIYNIFPPLGNPIWYINEEPLDGRSGFSQLPPTRNILQLKGPDGSFKQFAHMLHWHIFDKIPINFNEQTAHLFFKEVPRIHEDIQYLREMYSKVVERLDWQNQKIAELQELLLKKSTEEVTGTE